MGRVNASPLLSFYGEFLHVIQLARRVISYRVLGRGATWYNQCRQTKRLRQC
jgi:hypothetical protein